MSILAVCLLLLVTAMAASVRCAQANESLWLDELHTAWVVAGQWSDIESRARIGNQSPLYFYLVRGTTSIMGMSEVSLRLPSLLAGISLVPMAWWLTWKWTRLATAALVVATLAAWDHWCVFYAQEARSYALVQVVGLLQIGCFWRLLHSASQRWRVGLVLATTAMFYLHYTSLVVVAGECVAYAVHYAFNRKTVTYRPWHVLLDAGFCTALIAPALPHLWEIALHRDNWSLMVKKPDAARFFTLLSLGPYLALPLGGLITSHVVRRATVAKAVDLVPDRTQREAMVLTTCWFCIPLAATWLLTTCDIVRLFMVRYLVAVIVAPMILCGLLLAAIPGTRLRYGVVAAVLIISLQHSGLVSQLRHHGRLVSDRNQDWRNAVARIQSDVATNSWPVLVRSGFVEADRLRTTPSDPLLRAYCLAPVTAIYRLDNSARTLIPLPTTDAGRLTGNSLQALQVHSGAWVVIYGAARSRPRIERDLIASLRGIGIRVEINLREIYGNILVLRLSRDRPESPATPTLAVLRSAHVPQFQCVTVSGKHQAPQSRQGGVF